MATGRPNGRPKTPKRNAEPLKDIPQSPPHLDAAGVAIWNLVWTEGAEWLTPADYYAVLTLAEAWSEKEHLRSLIATGLEQRVIDHVNGSRVTNPVVHQLKEAKAAVQTGLSALGFTPTDRARLGLTGETAESVMMQFIQQTKNARQQAANKETK